MTTRTLGMTSLKLTESRRREAVRCRWAAQMELIELGCLESGVKPDVFSDLRNEAIEELRDEVYWSPNDAPMLPAFPTVSRPGDLVRDRLRA